ncbi:hypothetical protein F5J12DRAFT_740372 [Pisolithus orientalis]|uniref:uncharacterized protein n=1 Tax=Pisolithus orientalis TaxID=936130 RepID=UPI0022251F71|nr:uncharacterized protein F5J12DRAFT_740372 [Pisolithus orientalis]KAI6012799.1 hypothetical protein F5J12DRAFT_740372 [Pisolithus orientalis]
MAPGCCGILRRLLQRPHRSLNSGVVTPQTGIVSTGDTQTGGHALAPTVAVPAPTRTTYPNSPVATVGFPALTDVTSRAHSPQGSADDAVPPSTAGTPKAFTYRMDPTEARSHVKRINRFRVLLMGRANAGKTTILQRLCNTKDQPEVFDGEGRKVEGSEGRGYHNIEYELVFESNPGFVFHDSCGFEAGSEAQFEKMKEFVMDRAKTPKLEERVHAIWFCIPLTDNHRMVTTAERRFFDGCDTGGVPVIVLLTKADTLELEAIKELEECGLGMDKAWIAEIEGRKLKENITKVRGWLYDFQFPPCAILPLTGMQQEHADCTALLKCTAEALNEENLQILLISTQQSNLELCIEFAVMKALKGCIEQRLYHWEPTRLAAALAIWFPYQVSKGMVGWWMYANCVF